MQLQFEILAVSDFLIDMTALFGVTWQFLELVMTWKKCLLCYSLYIICIVLFFGVKSNMFVLPFFKINVSMCVTHELMT